MDMIGPNFVYSVGMMLLQLRIMKPYNSIMVSLSGQVEMSLLSRVRKCMGFCFFPLCHKERFYYGFCLDVQPSLYRENLSSRSTSLV